MPLKEPFHALRCIKGRRRFKDDAHFLPGRIKGRHVVRQGFPIPAMPFIFRAIAQKITMKLKDDALCQRQALPSRLHRLHDISIPSHVLFIARLKGLRLQRPKKLRHLLVTQPCAFDPRGGPHTLDRRHPSQRLQPIRRQVPQRLPRALELINPADEP